MSEINPALSEIHQAIEDALKPIKDALKLLTEKVSEEPPTRAEYPHKPKTVATGRR